MHNHDNIKDAQLSYASFLLLLCNLNFFYVSRFEFWMSPAPMKIRTPFLCFFNTSVVVSVISSAPSIRFCKSSIVNSPLFSRADPKISHKYTWSALLKLSANSSKNFSVRENVCGWNTATISRSGCFDESLQSLH